VLVAACGSSATTPKDAPADDASSDGSILDPDGARSGSRLKLTWFEFSDGTRQWSSFYDAERKENCYPSPPWVDGHVYCTPDDNASIVYADASCAQKVGEVLRDPSCSRPPPKYLLEWRNDACSSAPARLYLRGDAVTQTQYWIQDVDGSCIGPLGGTGLDFYAVGAEVTPSNLVNITLGDPVGTGPITERFWQSADGMRLPHILHDNNLDTDCVPTTYVEGGTSGVCVPTSTGTASYFHDASCTQPEVGLPRICPVPQYAEVTGAMACAADPPQFALVGSAVAATSLFSWTGTQCVATTPTSTSAYYTLRGGVAFATLQRHPDAAQSHRIQVVHYTSNDVSFRDSSLYDSVKGVTCYPTSLPDGSTVCLPEGGAAISTFYRDATCTQTIDLVELYVGPNGCTALPPAYARKYIAPPPDSCQYNTELHTVSSPYAGTVYTNYGTCQPYTPTTTKLYSVGPAVPTSDFVSATVSIDP
jgi:hypothetical protein